MLQYGIEARRTDARSGAATCRSVTIPLDTAARGREDALNPSELLLTALAASILRNLERVAQQISFEFREAHVEVHAQRTDTPPRIAAIEYVLTIETDESDRRLALLHTNVRKRSTIYNTLLPGTRLHGVVERAGVRAAEYPEVAVG